MDIGSTDLSEHFPDVSRETIEDLRIYESLLVKWNRKINLVAPDTVSQFWSRHVLDSLQLARYLPPQTKSLIDLGSGGGFPGLPLAIFLKDRDIRITLVDSDQRKCEFLRTVARVLALHINVVNGRILDLPQTSADVVTARALAPLVDLMEFADHHMAPEGTALFLKGMKSTDEIEAAQTRWKFKYKTHPSITQSDAAILEIGEISRV